MGKRVVFTDLDGTLLDPFTYSYEESLPALRALRREGIPVVFCSAKTRLEILALRAELGVQDPFVAENGAAVFIPRGYFNLELEERAQELNSLLVVELGARLEEFKWVIEEELVKLGCGYSLFSEMSAEEIAEETGLTVEMAGYAKAREYSETIKIDGGRKLAVKALRALESRGLSCTAGERFLTVTSGGVSKGRAVKVLQGLYEEVYGPLLTYGFGDSYNDLSMLREVDVPVLVKRPSGNWIEADLPVLLRVDEVGPRGFRRGVELVLGLKL